MSLRPRYSLLALLLYTAAVAAGIKLWRGPHRVSINSYTEIPNPLQNPTQLATDDPLRFKLLITGLISGAQELDYDYLRTLSGEHQLQAARFRFRAEYNLDMLLGNAHLDGNEFFVHQIESEDKSWHHSLDGQRVIECAVNCVLHGITDIERLVCWGTNDTADFATLRASRASMSEFGSYTEAMFPFPARSGPFEIYFLTDRGNLYQVHRPENQTPEKSFCVVKRLSLSEVSRPLRSLLGEELDRLAIAR